MDPSIPLKCVPCSATRGHTYKMYIANYWNLQGGPSLRYFIFTLRVISAGSAWKVCFVCQQLSFPYIRLFYNVGKKTFNISLTPSLNLGYRYSTHTFSPEICSVLDPNQFNSYPGLGLPNILLIWSKILHCVL